MCTCFYRVVARWMPLATHMFFLGKIERNIKAALVMSKFSRCILVEDKAMCHLGVTSEIFKLSDRLYL